MCATARLSTDNNDGFAKGYSPEVYPACSKPKGKSSLTALRDDMLVIVVAACNHLFTVKPCQWLCKTWKRVKIKTINLQAREDHDPEGNTNRIMQMVAQRSSSHLHAFTLRVIMPSQSSP